ncbi:MAG: SDR family NAD(P)-dependent oxidoreductase [Lewinella sp.]|uniref:SDR family NAD(P)-dependent oxidoreductase n=1 Tax=Lewinella sp. TaxID=2004506 RepID=UPI003D6ACCC8
MLANKSVLLVGGLNSAGLAILDQLLEYGARIIVIDDEEKLDQYSDNPKYSTITFVNGKLSDADELGSSLEDKMPSIPLLQGVVFASGAGGVRPLSLSKPQRVREMFEANCACFIEVMRLLLRKKKLEEGASVVAISSISSILGLKSKLAYAVSKAALNAAVRNIAAELAPRRIRVNTILKGPMTIDYDLEHISNLTQLGSEVKSKNALGDSTPDDLGNLVCFLISDMVQTMTGTEIKLDGGYSL